MEKQLSLFNSDSPETPLNWAKFSDCGKYRFFLQRMWDESLPSIMFIGLNPSTANESTDDPTIRRVKGFAKEWGFGGVYMVNLFGIVSSDPSIIIQSPEPVGKDNNRWIKAIAKRVQTVVFAWGAFTAAKASQQDSLITNQFPKAIALRKTKDGFPGHPLYVPSNVKPIYFSTGEPWEGIQ
jgi:hypothetical protein